MKQASVLILLNGSSAIMSKAESLGATAATQPAFRDEGCSHTVGGVDWCIQEGSTNQCAYLKDKGYQQLIVIQFDHFHILSIL